MPAVAPPDLNADACVIGGSIAGLLTALCLARRGVDVVLLERGVISPVQRSGLLTPGLTLWASAVSARASKDTARAAFDLSLEAVAEAVALLESLGLERTGRGLLRVGGSHEAGVLDAEAAARDLLGLPELRRWRGPEIAATIASTRYDGATYEPHAVLFDTATLGRVLATAARTAGVRILERTPAQAADLGGVRKYVHTPAGRVRADHVVLCGGRGIEPVTPWLARALGIEHWVRGGFGVRAARPDFSGLVAEPGALGARFVPREGELSFEAPTASRIRGEVSAAVTLRRRARAVYPELGRSLAEHAGGFSLSRTPSGLPLIGEDRPGVWYAAGLGGNPLANAALAADVITAAIVERSQKIADLAPFQPHYAFGLAGRAAATAAFWWLRVQDGVAHMTADYAQHRAAARDPQAVERPSPTAPALMRSRLRGKAKRVEPRLHPAGHGAVAHSFPMHGMGAASHVPGSSAVSGHAGVDEAPEPARDQLHAVP